MVYHITTETLPLPHAIIIAGAVLFALCMWHAVIGWRQRK